MLNRHLKVHMDKTDFFFILPLVNENLLFVTQAKNLCVIFDYILCITMIYQKILLAPRSKYIKNQRTSYHLHCYHIGLSPFSHTRLLQDSLS